MRTMLVHMSDIHLVEDEHRNPVLKRSTSLARAVGSRIADTDMIVLIISGDIAFSGTRTQYEHAYRLVQEIKSTLSNDYNYSRAIQVLTVPGNHDCDYARGDQLRTSAIRHIQEQPLTDNSIIDKLLTVQRDYFEFAQAISGMQFVERERLVRHHYMRSSTGTFRISLFNSAWSCVDTTQEQRLLPPCTDEASFLGLDSADIVVSIIHHPSGWFDVESGKIFRDYLEKDSHLLLSGHEHQPDAYTKIRGEKSIDYIEGGQLQSSKDYNVSEFSIIHVEPKSGRIEHQRFVWTDRQMYEPNGAMLLRDVKGRQLQRAGRLSITDMFARELDDLGVAYTHPRRDPLRLHDVYVVPDCRRRSAADASSDESILKSRDVVDYCMNEDGVVFVGTERCGKTCLGKVLFAAMQDRRLTPVLLRAKQYVERGDKDLTSIINLELTTQYGDGSLEKFWQLPVRERVVIVDDVHLMSDSVAARNRTVTALQAIFGKVILLASDEITFDEIEDTKKAEGAIWTFQRLDILPFGEALRYKLITNWYAAGSATSIDSVTSQRTIAESDRLITSLLHRDLIPSYPFLILSMLQSIEANLPLDVNHGSFGHMYLSLITLRLAQVKDNNSLDTKLNYLTELAYYLYSAKSHSIGSHEFNTWHNAFCSKFAIELSADSIRGGLVRAGILEERAGNYRFKHKYIFLFFVARYLGIHIKEMDVRAQVQDLALRLYNEESANIMMFLCYASKDAVIIETALQATEALFPGINPCNLDDDCREINRMAADLPRLVLSGAPAANQIRLLESKDECRQFDISEHVGDAIAEGAIKDETAAMAEVNSAFKTIQILGQIVRNFSGSLPAAEKMKIASACYSLSLRTMGYFMSLFRLNATDMIRDYATLIEHRDGRLQSNILQMRVSRSLFASMELLALTLVRHLSNAIGMEVLSPTFRAVLADNPNTATRMIDLAIKLDHDSTFPRDEIDGVQKEVLSNPFALTLLRMLVFLHFYVFNADYSIRQSVCAQLDIEISKGAVFDPRTKRLTASRSQHKKFKDRKREK